ncbi:Rad52/Rad22 family DNA repair protein [Planococcus lenghuensis]|uniref:Rad52/22 family double-strand break repair protein n=1 Tax=Planococcus lenghuensis TaxID=2213202 RepID=A0A1Q2L4G3_9BACL|nr:Rad52/Rad22 family DNA repair protein [Planococcus lenghuensis]AQQ55329.1 hypothetical protein B0X71_19335 [Planococcus lenghuensis]
MEERTIMETLKAPFQPSEIEWRVQSATRNQNGVRLLVVPYITARGIMDRLDAILGAQWTSTFQQMKIAGKEGFGCSLSIKIGDEWITRTDGAEVSDIESIKGGHSNALKRAAVQWGVGRYLYDLPKFWVPLKDRGNNYVNGKFKISGKDEYLKGGFDDPQLPKEFLPADFKYSNSQGNSQQQQSQQPPQRPSQGKPSGQQPSASNQPPASQGTDPKLAVTQLLTDLQVKREHVEHLFHRAIGQKMTVGQATTEQLRELYKALYPVRTYLNFCHQAGLSMEKALYFAQITVREPLNEPHNLFFKMNKSIADRTIEMIKEDMAQQQPA